MKFGDHNTFAITIRGLQLVQGMLFGRAAFYVSGELIGNSVSAPLYPFYSHLLSLEEKNAAAPAVTDDEVSCIFARIQHNIDTKFAQLSDAEIDEAMRDERFQLAPGGGEFFDGWTVLLAETANASHILYQDLNGPSHEHTFPNNQVTAVLQQCRDWFEIELAKSPAELTGHPISDASYQQARAELHAFLLAFTANPATKIVGAHANVEAWWDALIGAGWSRLLAYTLLWDLIRAQGPYSDEAWNILTETEHGMIGHCDPSCFDHFYGEPENYQEHIAYVRSQEWLSQEVRERFGFRDQGAPGS